MPKARATKAAEPATALPTLVDDYLAHCRAHGLAPNTVNQAYKYPLIGVLLPLVRARRDRGRVGDHPSRAGPPLGLAPGVRWAQRQAALAAFGPLLHAGDQPLPLLGEEGGEPVEAKAQLPKLPKRLVEVLSRDEITRMEHAAKTERDKLIIRLLADTGLPVGELLCLSVNDLVEQNRNYYLHVRGKRAKDRIVPSPKFYQRLRIYLERDRPKDAVNCRMFLSRRRRPTGGDYEPLTTSGVDRMIRIPLAVGRTGAAARLRQVTQAASTQCLRMSPYAVEFRRPCG